MSLVGTTSRTCAICGSDLITGFSACSECGAMQRAQFKPISPVVGSSFRNNQLHLESRDAKRRSTRFAAVIWIALGCVSLGGVYVALPVLRLTVAASQWLIVDPVTVGDEFHNQAIHDARRKLYLE